MAINNPLRYPGAKSKLVSYIQKLIENENLTGCIFYEAYAGSAAASFGLLENKIISRAVINEIDPLIYSFWYSVMNHTEELIQLIETTEITLETWKEISLYRETEYLQEKTIVQIGFAGLFLNRTNFSGILNANPIGGMEQKSEYKINCRFNKNRIVRSIRELSKFAEQIEIYNMDALDFLRKKTKYKRNTNTFVYIDPPYYDKGPSLYRYYYLDDMHKELADFIKTKAYPWLISYDDTPAIRRLYRKRKQQQIYLDYSVNTHRLGEELLISNLEIPPLEAINTSENELIG